MRYVAKIDDRNYTIQLNNNELLMIDLVAKELAMMYALKTYGNRYGVTISVIETRGGRGIEPSRRFWTYEGVIAKLGEMGVLMEWRSMTFLINELPPKAPRIVRAKKSPPIESKTLKQVLQDI